VNGNGKKGKKGSEGWADPRTDDQRLMIKLGSNRVVDFDGRLDVLNLLRNLVRRASKALSPKRLAHRVTGPRHGSEMHRSICGAGGKRPSQGEKLVGDPQTDLQPIRKITKREMQTKRKIPYGNNTVTNIIGSLPVTSSYRLA
jgi:hypothetical protein